MRPPRRRPRRVPAIRPIVLLLVSNPLSVVCKENAERAPSAGSVGVWTFIEAENSHKYTNVGITMNRRTERADDGGS